MSMCVTTGHITSDHHSLLLTLINCIHIKCVLLFSACDCNPSGTTGRVCGPTGNQCPCKPNFSGNKCDRCAAGYYGYPQCQRKILVIIIVIVNYYYYYCYYILHGSIRLVDMSTSEGLLLASHTITASKHCIQIQPCMGTTTSTMVLTTMPLLSDLIVFIYLIRL